MTMTNKPTEVDRPSDEPDWWLYHSLPHDDWRGYIPPFYRRCRDYLWSDRPGAENARRFFQGRGFSPETIRDAGIGLNPKDQYRDRCRWGLPGGPQHSRIWLPRGLVFPWTDDRGLCRLYIRRPRNDVDPKSDDWYERRAGHHSPNCISPLYGAQSLDPGLPTVLVEREFDALAIQDEAGDLCSPVATGRPGGARRKKWWRLLSKAPAVLVAFDGSDAGEEAAEVWLDALPNGHRWETYAGRNGDRMTPGRKLRDWVQDGIDSVR